ncbi:MAG: glycosyltransferase family 2 protein [Polyangia bacterium]
MQNDAATPASAERASLVPYVSVIIPCFNEIDALPQLERKLPPVLELLEKRFGPLELILVDDGSTDGTLAALRGGIGKDPRARIVPHERNQGLGAALRTGFAAARGEVLVTTDADGTYDFGEMLGLLSRLTPDVDVVTASPYHPEGQVAGVPAYRLILSQGASFIYRALLDPSVYCYTAMFRAYRRRVIDSVSFRSPGYLAMAEILSEALLAGFKIVEFPTVLSVRKYGQSKARVARIIRDHLRFQAGLVPRALPLQLDRIQRRLQQALGVGRGAA